ncbi:response regulator transcription factor [Clostridium botulinum]|uniref:Stage 0 sporulation protein A homolog n=1 Tax=Clostridium botulinum (strain Okra / Type B1) TaxID=498213 RepID=B1IFI7_CLOBK|nr:response regulator transcription factor [Clostridium botulinum]EKX79149.1 DNA-binding response regulator [Clostridium botulinum CFSAN001628]ACA46064.1 DNA-binding response regulator [Clostridium botulinum B1 str. Okra]MBD5561257.1 response regulator transcription factor [Clostridium botulinum]MBD5567443.1 response regulator transcription factor [Clostridium botulinum]MBD5571491.1 response regulator transcription factor [Clostridium botulinum]
MSYKILIVDDDKTIVEFLQIFLIKEGYEVRISYNGEEALDKIRSEQFNLILMDIMMPKLDGFEAIKRIRKLTNIPIIFLTAKDSQQDKIKGFISGCDDYITKPFDLVELSLRVSAILKRVSTSVAEENKDIIKVKDLELNLKEHTLYKEKNEIKLTPKEFDILFLLARNKGRIFPSSEIYERVWGQEFLENDNSLLTHIRNLREKLSDTVKNSKYIKTVWGVGYKIEKEA